MTVSVCMMVRDCEATLPRALASVADWCDELCIIDTGSVDKTADIARAAADRFEFRMWPGSFSEARNWTLEMATSDYIFVLDSDEYIQKPKAMGRRLKAKLKEKPAALDVQVINTVGDGEITDTLWQVRCFRNDDRIRYHSVVHHQCQYAIRAYIDEEGGTWSRLHAFRIIHTGYDLDGAGRRKKYRPRIALYAQAVKDATSERDREYYRYQQGVGMYQAGYPAAAITLLERVNTLHLDPGQTMHTFSVLCKAHLQRAIGGEAVDHRAAAGAAAVLVSRYPNSETLQTAAHLALALGQHVEALALYLRAFIHKGGSRRVDKASLIKNITLLMEGSGNTAEANQLRTATPRNQEQIARFVLDVLGVAA